MRGRDIGLPITVLQVAADVLRQLLTAAQDIEATFEVCVATKLRLVRSQDYAVACPCIVTTTPMLLGPYTCSPALELQATLMGYP